MVYYIDRSVLLKTTPLVKFIRNYIRDPDVISRLRNTNQRKKILDNAFQSNCNSHA